MPRRGHEFRHGGINVGLPGGQVLSDFPEGIAKVCRADIEGRAFKGVAVAEECAVDQATGVEICNLLQVVRRTQGRQIALGPFAIDGVEHGARPSRAIRWIDTGAGEERARGRRRGLHLGSGEWQHAVLTTGRQQKQAERESPSHRKIESRSNHVVSPDCVHRLFAAWSRVRAIKHLNGLAGRMVRTRRLGPQTDPAIPILSVARAGCSLKGRAFRNSICEKELREGGGSRAGEPGAILRRRAGQLNRVATAMSRSMPGTRESAAVFSIGGDSMSERRRRTMIAEQLVARGIRDSRVLEAMAAVSREAFVAPHLIEQAYEDRALPSEAGQTISQPYIVAYMTECLGVAPGHRVLEIGTGTGYQTAILARLAAEVFTVERLADLSHHAMIRLADLEARNVRMRVGDGTLGWPDKAPFDRILVTAAAPAIVSPLLEQLAVGGRMVLPIGPADRQHLVAIDKLPHRNVETPLLPVVFVPLVGEAGFAEAGWVHGG